MLNEQQQQKHGCMEVTTTKIMPSSDVSFDSEEDHQTDRKHVVENDINRWKFNFEDVSSYYLSVIFESIYFSFNIIMIKSTIQILCTCCLFFLGKYFT